MSGSKFKHSNLRLGGKSPLHSSAVKLENDSDVTINTLSNSSVGSSMSGNTNSSSSVSGVQNPTARTVIIDTSSCTSADVGVQATPAAVSADLETSRKQQRGILHVTSEMRKLSINGNGQSDNLQSKANTKEKTPMCQINELARFNKLAHKYVLVDEKGPAHKKEFHIRLDFGSESYLAVGSSIKRAQHAAAEEALSQTSLPRPAFKSPRIETPTPVSPKKTKPVLTPTVELNALAMKLGEQTHYVNVDTVRMPHMYSPYMYSTMHNYHYHPLHPHHTYHNPFMSPHTRHRYSQPFAVVLRIGQHEFKGHGTTRQHARHNAASKALKVLNSIPLQRKPASPSMNNTSNPPNTESPQTIDSPTVAEMPAEESSPLPTSPQPSSVDQESDETKKSEISQVHELALQYGKEITFEIIHESGPPHLRTFTTRAVCGDLVSEGEGNSKKDSKKKAAENMLIKLKESVSPTSDFRQKVKNLANKKKNRNLIKMQKANVEYGSGINPISRLIQIQQANKRKEPVYTLVMEHGAPRRREFIIQVKCNEKTCQGKGPNKKLAKRNAAEEMLQIMGYSKPTPLPAKSSLKSADSSGNSSSQRSKHVTFVDSVPANKLPGVLVRSNISEKSSKQELPQFDVHLAASLAKDLLEHGESDLGNELLAGKEHVKRQLDSPKEQLEYLGLCMGISMEFIDFPKGTNTKTFTTLVTLQTIPPQVFQGDAATVEMSHDKAALKALNQFANSVTKSHIDEKEEIEVTEKTKADESTRLKTTMNGDTTESSNTDTDKPSAIERNDVLL